MATSATATTTTTTTTTSAAADDGSHHQRRLQQIGLSTDRARTVKTVARDIAALCKQHRAWLRGSALATQPPGSIVREAFSRLHAIVQWLGPAFAQRYGVRLRSYRSFARGTDRTRALDLGAALQYLSALCERMSFGLARDYIKSRVKAQLWTEAPPGGAEPRDFDVDPIADYALRRTDLWRPAASGAALLAAYLQHQGVNLARFREAAVVAIGAAAELWPMERVERVLETMLRQRYGRTLSTTHENELVQAFANAAAGPRSPRDVEKWRGRVALADYTLNRAGLVRMPPRQQMDAFRAHVANVERFRRALRVAKGGGDGDDDDVSTHRAALLLEAALRLKYGDKATIANEASLVDEFVGAVDTDDDPSSTWLEAASRSRDAPGVYVARADYAARRRGLSQASAANIARAYEQHARNVRRFRDAVAASVDQSSSSSSMAQAERALETMLRREYSDRFDMAQEQALVDAFVAERRLAGAVAGAASARRSLSSATTPQRGKRKVRAATQPPLVEEQPPPPPRSPVKHARTVAPRALLPLTRRGDRLCAEPCRREGSLVGSCWCPVAGGAAGAWDYCTENACNNHTSA